MVIFANPLTGTIEILQPRDFGRFSVRAPAAGDDVGVLRKALADVADVIEPRAVWVSEHALRNWDGLVDQDWWQTGLSAMIEMAASHGWVDGDGKRIKAHIEPS